MGQAIKAGQIINQINFDAKAPDNTALVLPDEKLLLPVLYSLPESIGPVNVTMGYPFKYTHLYHLVSLLFQMQENAEMFAQKRQNSTKSFYAKDILKILAHPYLLLFDKIVASGQVTFDRITESIRKKNRVFIGPGEIKQHAAGAENEYKNLVDNLFTPWTSAGEALDSILRTLEFIRDRLIAAKVTQTAAGQIDLEYVYFLSKVVKRCRTMMETYPFIRDLKTLRKILFQVLDTSRMPFTGEPLQGLQVMGVLETRAIDFENLVVLSVNDGILPSGRLPNSFIPFDIKYEFGLPTYRQKDAVFAYHFYRMLQRARNIFLIYDTEGDQMKGGEKSRFLMQLGYELPRYNSNSLISEELLGPDPPGNNLTNIIIREKTPAVMARLNEKAARGFSPTALNLYIRCPLQFYFQEVLGLSEAESIEETIEQKTMGTAIHKVFQRIYEPFTGKFLDPDTLYSRLSVTESVLSEAFGEFYKEGDLEYGKNHLIFKASQFLINEFIRHEIEELRNCDNPAKALKIISLETLLEVSLTIHISGAPYEIKLKGKTDRIDRFGDAVRIIDYKTGSVQASELKVRSWDTLLDDPKMSKAFQLLMYAWLYVINSKASGHEVQTGNITLRKISAGFMKVSLPGDQEIGNESMKAFEELLKELLARIFDQGILFTQTEDIENCTYCPFKSICSR
jgi:CRISPR/Cas system-associated exonuclease Cas4 (RecB family)